MNWVRILGLVILVACFSSMSYNAYAEEPYTNQLIKLCLEENGYDQKNFDTFDFSKAMMCINYKKQPYLKAERKQMADLLKEKPWYKGPNFKWEQRAEYTCSKIYSTAHAMNVTVCQKPFYLN